MDGFHFFDPFATKGIEYILVIGYLVAIVFFFRLLRAKDRGHGHGRKGARAPRR